VLKTASFSLLHQKRRVVIIESILKQLQNLPTPKLVEVARYVHGLSAAAQKERLSVLRETHGVLSEEDGETFEAW
jgi:hypothetical protein